MSGNRGRDRWLGLLAREWPIITVAVAMIWMFYLRIRTYGNFLVDGRVYFSGNDAWYHLRQVQYTVAHFPRRMPFDPWTQYPFGRLAGQFGTLYDQIVAATALMIGLGSPTDQQVAITLLLAPAVIGTLVAIPTYLIGKELDSRTTGAVAVIILALLPGTFLRRGLVGFADHNIAEPLFMLVALWGLMLSLRVSEKSDVDISAIQRRKWSNLTPALRYGGLAGVASVLYIWVWPPGVLLLGILAIAMFIMAGSDIVDGLDYSARTVPVAMAMLVVVVFTALRINEPGLGVTGSTLLQPLAAIAVLVGVAGLLLLVWFIETFDIRPLLGVVGLHAAAFVGLAILAVGAPRIFGALTGNFEGIIGFGTGAGTRTIGEAQPFVRGGDITPIVREYGLTFFVAAASVIWLLAAPILSSTSTRRLALVVGGLSVTGIILALPTIPASIGSVLDIPGSQIGFAVVALLFIIAVVIADHPPDRILFMVWVGIMTAATFTQVRFNY